MGNLAAVRRGTARLLRPLRRREKGEAGKVNGSQAAAPVTETGAPFVTGEAKPILREPVKPLEGAPLHMLNDYYAAKKRWNEQQRGQ